MILDNLKNASTYNSLHPLFAKAFEFLNRADLTELEAGKHELVGDKLFAIIAHDKGRKVTEGELEAHREYIDIQYIISGDESMGWKPCDNLTTSMEYDAERDLEFFTEDPDAIAQVHPGNFAIFFPADAHLPLIGYGPIHKVIIKIAVEA